MRPRLKTLIARVTLMGAFIAGAVVSGALHGASAASMPHLSFPCGAPSSAAVVTCRLSGKGFYPHERVRIAYRVDISLTSGRHVRAVYRRTTITDGRGSLTRPVFRLRVDPRVLIYTTTVVVTGLRGNYATITTAGTP
jgi:hypothetical protein